MVEELRASPYLTRFPASVDPSPFAVTVRFRESHPPLSPLPTWWGESEAPLVYMSSGTVLGHMSIAPGVYAMALGAAGRLEARVLLTVGHRFDPSGLVPLPANVHVEGWVDQARVLDHADVVVCHGGSGTAFGALGAGVPVVLVPLFADQFENARRIASAGAGIMIEAATQASDGSRTVIGAEGEDRIAEAVGAVLGDNSYRRHARLVAEEMAAAPSVDEVLAKLLSDPLSSTVSA